MSDRGGLRWTVVVLTCQHKDSVYSFQRELELRQQRGSLSQGALVLTVRDRQEPLGSGGATLNALLVAAEHLSSRAGHTVVTADVLDDAHVLILHTGRDFPWSSCSRAFCWLPREKPDQRVQAPVCCLDLLLDCLSNQVCAGSPPGVWVCSTDMILTIPPDFGLSWEGFSGVRVLALPGDVFYAANHGVYLSDHQGRVRNIIYRGTQEQIQQAVMPDGKVPLVSGPVFFSRAVSEKLLQTHVTPPLDGCTYLGLDSGAPPLQISLFLDVLKCLCSDLTQDQFVSEDRAGCSSALGPQGAVVRSGRTELWRILRGTPLTLVYVPGGRYDYLTLSGKQHVERLTCDWTDGNTLSHVQRDGGVDKGARVINSVLEGDVAVAPGAVVQHCHLQGPLVVPSGCLLSGLELMTSQWIRQLELASDIIIQGHRIELGQLKLSVYTVTGAQDDLEVSSEDSSASFLNQRWSLLYSRTGIQPEELWVRGQQRSLLEARLFPVLHPRGGAVGLEGGVGWLLGGGGCLRRWREAWRLSLKEVMSLTHQEAELQWREELLFLAGRRRVADSLRRRSDVCLLPSFRAAVLGGRQEALLEALDGIAAGSGQQGAESGAELGVAARCLSCIADVLVCMAGGRGGLRSGPAANEAWSSAYLLLEEGDLRGGVCALATQRERWLSRPDLLVRAARHYEGAGQVLLRQAVMSSQKFISIGQGEVPPLDEWQEVECPARLDLAGGWSDTPPIAFEHGGSVTNVAVKVDGKRPMGARARRIREPRLLLVSHIGGRDSAVSTETVCDSLDDLRDHRQPHAPGALLKAVCVCSGLVALSSQHPLGDQLMQRWGGGVELHSWSLLPTGSGLGTSSILAGALLAAVYRCTGRTYNTDSLIHAVLYLEQILTTGGGWQDQVGGLVGGVKVGRSRASLPLLVEVERLSPPEDFLVSLERHLLLVYTGKTRLARNLLQDVVRSWYSRLPSMVQTKMEEYPSKQVTENLDDPPNSRLFAVTSRSITEDELRESFSVFGEIQGVWVVKDKQTKESKGISYVKFAKSSQACLAMEEMHGKVLVDGTKPIKVFIAQSRSSTRHRDVEDEELTRIFVMIPKTFTEEDLKNTFKEYGDIEYCVIIKNKTTGESKGLGYVRYYKPSQAALAIENCDKSYRAILAEPRTKAAATEEYTGGSARGEYMGGGGGGGGGSDSMNQYAFPLADPGNYPVMDYRSGDFTRCLMMSTRAALSQEQIFALFDIIPGMEYCELQRDAYGMSKGHALIRYSNLGSAVYAKEKLNGFEYPPGNRLAVNFVDDGEERSSPVGRMAMQFVATQMMSAVWNGPSSSQVMKSPGFSAVSPMSRVQTDVSLPPLKKLAPPDSKAKERLFVVFSPSPLPLDVLEDVFCRFGSLIEVHLVPGRKVGYMKYADKQCADEAMAVLHGRVVNGVKMKVMLADPPREESHKRPRTY